MTAKRLDGDNLLYKLFVGLLAGNDEASESLMKHIIRATAIWFPPQLYEQYPVLLPWVVRDPKCRPHVIDGRRSKEQWAAPNEDGYLRDDNSLIKGIPKSLAIRGPATSLVKGQRMGSGFVASHVWRDVRLEKLATRDPRLNSFVPNLVWLPRQLAKLADREGSPFQEAMKSVSVGLYRNLPVPSTIQSAVEEIWALLPESKCPLEVSPEELNYFVTPSKFFDSRNALSKHVLRFLESIENGTQAPPRGRIPPRYYGELPRFPVKVIKNLRQHICSLWNTAET